MKKVPYWHQTSEVTCGPSCLLMLFNYYNKNFGLSRKREFELLRGASLLVWRGTHPYGLAICALRRKFKVSLLREKKTIWKDPNFSINNNSLEFVIKIQEKQAKKLGLKEKVVKKIKLNDLKKILDKGSYPLVLMKLIEKNKKIGVQHWVVLLKIEKNCVIIHDPYYKANRKIPIKLFVKGWNAIKLKKWGQSKEVLIIRK